jgi:DNA polymerase III epsilon subunit-like protein
MYQKLFENWRSFKKIINEDVETRYGNNYAELRNLVDEASHRTWIFFDTETTGLGSEKDYNQMTQIAAIAVDPKGFSEDQEPQILDRINVKLNLGKEALRFKKWQEEKMAAGETFNMPMGKVFALTGYGVSPNPKKRARKHYIQHGEMVDVPKQEYYPMGQGMKMFVDFLDQYDERVILAQNAPFDVGYVNEAFRRMDLDPPFDFVVDTVQIFKKYISPIVKQMKEKKDSGVELTPEESHMLKSLTKINKAGKEMLTVSLGNLIQAFDVKNEGWHDALADVIMLMGVLRKALIYLDKSGAAGDVIEMQPAQGELSLDKPSDIPLQERKLRKRK